MDTLLKWSGKTSRGIRKQVALLATTFAVLFLHNLTNFQSYTTQSLGLYNISLDPDSEEFLVQLEKDLAFTKFLCHTTFFIGASIGFFVGWLLCQKLSPKKSLLINLTLNFILTIFNGFLAHYTAHGYYKYYNLGIRFCVGITFGTSNTAIFVLILDWAHAKNQVFAINYAFGWKFISYLIIGFLSIFELNWGYFLYFIAIYLVVLLLLDANFVQESPRWYREQQKFHQLRDLAFKLARKVRFNGRALLGKLMDEVNEQPVLIPITENKRCIMLQIVAIYSINAFTSITIQYSSGKMWSWTTEIFILAGFQIFAYFISMPFSSSKQKPLMIVTIFAGFLAISLQVLPSGIFYNLLLQISKFVTLLLDHFVLFFVLNFCLPSLKTPVSDAPPSASAATATFRTAKTHPNTLESARLRAKLLAVAEGFACFSRTLGVFFVLEIPFFFFTPTEDVGKPNSTVGQPPKMLLCAICYATELMVLIVGNAICCKWPSNLQPPRLSTDDKNRPILRLEAGNRYRTPRPQQP